jgi:hypothetical protein
MQCFHYGRLHSCGFLVKITYEKRKIKTISAITHHFSRQHHSIFTWFRTLDTYKWNGLYFPLFLSYRCSCECVVDAFKIVGD